MVDYVIINEEWNANGSSNNGGIREGYAIELSDDDLQKLNSMKVVVDQDLTVSVECNNISYISVPFQEGGLTYLLDKSPKDFIIGVPENLTKSTTFLDGQLYLFAKDNFPESDIAPIDITGGFSDAAVLSCDSITGEFELVLFYADCCDNSIYTFVRNE